VAIEQVLSGVGAVVVPIVGFALQTSRRERLRRRIDEYLHLAERIEPHGGNEAAELRSLARESARVLVRRDRRTLRLRLDPSAVFALLLLVGPAVIGAIFALRWSSDWKWFPFAFAVIWALLWGGVGITQLRKEASDDQPEIRG
jgi:hypothetical protein